MMVAGADADGKRGREGGIAAGLVPVWMLQGSGAGESESSACAPLIRNAAGDDEASRPHGRFVPGFIRDDDRRATGSFCHEGPDTHHLAL